MTVLKRPASVRGAFTAYAVGFAFLAVVMAMGVFYAFDDGKPGYAGICAVVATAATLGAVWMVRESEK